MNRDELAKTLSSPLSSHFVDVEHLPWEKTAYAGIEQKTKWDESGDESVFASSTRFMA